MAETFDTITEWCEGLFGPCKPARVAERAMEEMIELIDETSKIGTWKADAILEAADVVITLARVPGLWAAVEMKMAINRGRQWKAMGDGTGYHIKAA